MAKAVLHLFKCVDNFEKFCMYYKNNIYVWEDNIKMDLQEVRYGGVDWIKLPQNRDREQPSNLIQSKSTSSL